MVATNPVQKPLDIVLNCLTSVKDPNPAGFYQAHCPAHHDGNRSLSFKASFKDGVTFTCFAGCQREAILSSLNLTEEQMHTGGTLDPLPSSSLTLVDLAVDKLIRPEMLLTLGLEDIDHKGVKIPYFTMDSQPYARYRLRTNVKAKDGSAWNTDSKAAIIPYGLQKLTEARTAKRLIIVEGESDCWTLWAHKYPALGLPGAKMIGSLQTQYLEGIETIYVMQEPDASGQTFPTEVKKRLDKIGYKGKVYAVNLMEACQAKDPNDLHKKDMKDFKPAFEKALLHAKPLHKERLKPQIYRLADLQNEVLPDTKWAIPDVLPEGLSLLVGKPKLGKSWLLLALLQAIASGGVALGNIPVEQGQTLYISLEDNKKRLQKRINTLLSNGRAAQDFLYTTKWARLDEGGLEDLEAIIQSHPQLRLIGIDTWAKIKPRAQSKQKQQYDEDYDALTPLQEMAGKYGVAIIIVHHFRKMAGEDMIDQISGSTAMAGAVDNFLLLDRKRGETDAHLYAFGRDIEVEQDFILAFDQACASWVIKGNAEDVEVATTPARQAILDVLGRHPEGITLKDLAQVLGKNEHTTRNNIIPLRNENKVLLKENRYRLVTTSRTSNPSKTSRTSSQLSEGNEATSSTSQVTSLLSLTSNLVEPLVEQVYDVQSSQVTSLTSLTTDIIEAKLSEWHRPGTLAWKKQVERVGLPEMMQRRNAAIQQIREQWEG